MQHPQHREAAAVVHTRSALTLCAYLLFFVYCRHISPFTFFARAHSMCVCVCVNYRLHGVKVRKSAKREKGNFAAFHLVRGTHTKQRRRRTLEPPIILVLLLQFVVRFFKVTGCVGDHNQSKQPEVRLSIDNPTIFSCCVCVSCDDGFCPIPRAKRNSPPLSCTYSPRAVERSGEECHSR